MFWSRRGFTLLEMMTAMAICLLVIVLVVPIFTVSTKTVQNVERKLMLYETARNILDQIDNDIQLAVANERGGHWSLKSVAWEDDDPFTPPETATVPGAADAYSAAYRGSRRYADGLSYLKLDPTGFNLYSGRPHELRGGKAFPLNRPVLKNRYPEAWKASIRTSLLYPLSKENSDAEFSDTGEQWSRGEQLAEVGNIELVFVANAVLNQFRCHNKNGLNLTTYYDEVYDGLGPGKEVKVPPALIDNQFTNTQRRLAGIKIMDLDLSYWDDAAKRFVDPPDNAVIYFWPPPKSVRVTITVCDLDKRGTLTLSRMVTVPVGLGDGVVQNTMDDFYEAPGAVFNRTKDMTRLPCIFNGDASMPMGADHDEVNEAKLLTTDKKPIGWP